MTPSENTEQCLIVIGQTPEPRLVSRRDWPTLACNCEKESEFNTCATCKEKKVKALEQGLVIITQLFNNEIFRGSNFVHLMPGVFEIDYSKWRVEKQRQIKARDGNYKSISDFDYALLSLRIKESFCRQVAIILPVEEKKPEPNASGGYQCLQKTLYFSEEKARVKQPPAKSAEEILRSIDKHLDNDENFWGQSVVVRDVIKAMKEFRNQPPVKAAERKMKIAYIAHPISGDIAGNLERIRVIVGDINRNCPDVLPFAPYWLDCHALDDTIPAERERGIRNDQELFNRGIIDELWLFGPRISSGMQAEINLARKLNIPIYSMSEFINEF